jgi:hypothetical protein
MVVQPFLPPYRLCMLARQRSITKLASRILVDTVDDAGMTRDRRSGVRYRLSSSIERVVREAHHKCSESALSYTGTPMQTENADFP